jgi:hypothetical protein
MARAKKERKKGRSKKNLKKKLKVFEKNYILIRKLEELI